MPSLRRVGLLAAGLMVLLGSVQSVPAFGAAPPPNDDFADAAAITGDSGSVTGSLAGATVEPGEPGSDLNSASVWWAWTAPRDGFWRFELSEGSFGVWRGTAVDELTAASVSACADDGGRLHVTAGETYHIQVRRSWGYGMATLSWEPAGRPANDNFSDAALISGYDGGRDVSTCLATRESGEPTHPHASSRTVWFRWQAADKIRTTFQVPYGEAVVFVWRGNSVGSLTAAGDWDHRSSSVELLPEKGTVYHIQVAMHADYTCCAGGLTTLTWQHRVAFNDQRHAALGIPHVEADTWDRSGVIWTDNLDATREDGEPALVTGQSGATLWWQVEPQVVPATLILDTSQSTPDTVIGVFAGAPRDALTRVAVADGGGSTPGAARLSVTMATEKTYTVIVDGKSGQTGGIRLFWQFKHPRPGNDNFADAYVASGTSGTSRSWTWEATRQSGEPYHAGVKTTRTVWWRWTAPRAGRIVFNGPVDGPFVAYRGSTLGSLTRVASGVRPGSWPSRKKIEFIATAGTTYRLVIGTDLEAGGSGGPGPVALSWTLHPVPPSNDDVADARSISGSSGYLYGTTVGATPELDDDVASPEYSSTVWYRWTAPSSGWWRFTATYSDAAASVGVRVPGTEQLYQVNRRHQEPELWSAPYPGRQGAVYVRAVAGKTYKVVVGTPGPPKESTIRLNWSPGAPSSKTPVNDDLAKATALSGTQGTTNGDLTYSTSEPGETHSYGTRGVWYRWTAPATGRVTWHTAPGTSQEHLTFYRGSGTFSALVKLAASDVIDQQAQPAARLDVDVVAGTTYSIRVATRADYPGAFTLTWGKPTPPPANDDFADATTLSPASSGQTNGTLLWSSRQSEEPAEHYTDPGATVWYRWKPETSGLATVGVDTSFLRVDVWTGDGLTGLVPANSTMYEPESYRPTFQAVAGQTYWVQVAESGHSGQFELEWSMQRPPHDDFADAREIAGTTGSASWFSLVRATAEQGEPEERPGMPVQRSVWLRWTSAYAGQTEFVAGSGDSKLSIFTGDTVGSLSRVVGYRSETSVTFTAQAGQTYHIRIDGSADRTSVGWTQRWDSARPTVSVKAGSSVATTRWVDLTLGGSDTGSGLHGWYVTTMAPVGGELYATAWVPATSPSIRWSLTHTAYGGRPVDGLKRVYVQSIDKQGNRSALTSVSVTLDR